MAEWRDGATVVASGLSLARDPDDAAILEAIDLAVRGGECLLLEGSTGAGKSTLLRGLAGLPGVFRIAGDLERRGPVALLGQHVDTQLLCPTVGEEVALGLRGHALPDEVVGARVERALRDVGLVGFAPRETDSLSAGQRQRVALAALLALEPQTLLLDEPMSSLDPPSRRRLAGILDRSKRAGTGIVVAEHAVAELLPVADRFLRIEEGRLIEDGPRLPGALRSKSTVGEEIPLPDALDALPASTRLLITGPNGIGKSTRLRALARAGSARGPVSLVIQEPRRGLFARTVRDEVGFGLDRLAADPGEREARIDALLRDFALEGAADRSPRRLSFGEQHRLAIAASLASRPAFLLLDEPFAGLDAAARETLLATLERTQRGSGVGIVIASHDRDPLDEWCARVVDLGREGVESSPRETGPLPLAPRTHALQYRGGDSWLHRMTPGVKALLVLSVSVGALILESPGLLLAMLAAVSAGYLVSGLGARALWQDLRWLLLQSAILVGLTVALRGLASWTEGSRAALQITMAFLPAMLFVRTTRMDALLDALSGWLPERIGFAIGATHRFAPLFAREVGELIDMQRLRGARLALGELWRPGAWRDALACVAVPMTFRAVEIANEAADAAWIRRVAGTGNSTGAADTAEGGTR